MLFTSADVWSDVNSISAADVNRHRPTLDPMLSRPMGCLHRFTSADIGADVASPHRVPMCIDMGLCRPMSAHVKPLDGSYRPEWAADVTRHGPTSGPMLS